VSKLPNAQVFDVSRTSTAGQYSLDIKVSVTAIKAEPTEILERLASN